MRPLELARHAYRKATGAPQLQPVAVTGQAASDLIRDRLAQPGPAMVARFGGNELAAAASYLGTRGPGSTLTRALDYVRGRGGPLWWDEASLRDLAQVAGVFPRDRATVERFCERLLADAPCVDVLGSWLADEQLLGARLEGAVRVQLADLEPYYHRDPWSEVLAGKRVLVVHPFKASIERQYARRELLFADPRVLPAFELTVLEAVQSAGGTRTAFADWFGALDAMCEQIDAHDFDVALVGAGAYGFSLAAHVKRRGGKAVHLGGATQILFGIKGRRWEGQPAVAGLFNEHWVRPLESERPARPELMEDACYW